ncbi:hypothetical protein [Ferviditalea candida]|uniref:Uncharacterized protein n=1 Tax=Ferviditalea candida TaxID=3108399 RepID=A0ABU5ZG55_9BACL|nr:hypothetical protein [Paenibacillaceae bacterium T2]
MGKSKWLKWQIGAAGALGIALLFQNVKESPTFAKAVEKATAPQQQNDFFSNDDSVMNELFNSDPNSNSSGGTVSPYIDNQPYQQQAPSMSFHTRSRRS